MTKCPGLFSDDVLLSFIKEPVCLVRVDRLCSYGSSALLGRCYFYDSLSILATRISESNGIIMHHSRHERKVKMRVIQCNFEQTPFHRDILDVAIKVGPDNLLHQHWNILQTQPLI